MLVTRELMVAVIVLFFPTLSGWFFPIKSMAIVTVNWFGTT